MKVLITSKAKSPVWYNTRVGHAFDVKSHTVKGNFELLKRSQSGMILQILPENAEPILPFSVLEEVRKEGRDIEVWDSKEMKFIPFKATGEPNPNHYYRIAKTPRITAKHLEDFDLQKRFDQYLQHVGFNKQAMSFVQLDETRRAFMAGTGVFLDILRNKLTKYTDDEAEFLLNNMAEQITKFFEVKQ